jgi:hypothetical protein
VKKVLTVAALVIGGMWVVKNPAGAAADIRQFIHALSTLVSAL